jgi:hypothetical protein
MDVHRFQIEDRYLCSLFTNLIETLYGFVKLTPVKNIFGGKRKTPIEYHSSQIEICMWHDISLKTK